MHNQYGITNQMFSTKNQVSYLAVSIDFCVNGNAISWVFPFSNVRTPRWLFSLHTTSVEFISGMHIEMGTNSPKNTKIYGSVLVSCCAKNRHKLTLLEDLQLLRKTYKSSRRLMTSTEDLS